MEHLNLEKLSSTALMLPKENGEEKVVIVSPSNGGVGRILIREDTILANLQGCASCGRAQFTCGGMKKKWSALCWGKQSGKNYYCFLVFLSATFVLSVIGTIFFCFSNTINDAILSNMVIKNNSMAFSMWKRPTVQPLMKVHLFNYTNWERVRNGSDKRLHVEDVGPFTYSQQMERVKINFEGDMVSFQEKNVFHYLPEKSVGAHFDTVHVPNLPLLGVVSMAIDMNLNSISQIGLSSALIWTNHPDAFVKLPVHRFLWGYEDTIISSAKPILSLKGQLDFEQFGLLASKNGTDSDRFTINTGEFDMNKMNIIEKLNGKPNLNFWGSTDCNSISASDGTMFPPSLLDRNTTLHVFFPKLCRRVPFNYEKDVKTDDGIQLLRYRMPVDVFDDPDHNPSNQCFCEIDSATCPPRGVINVTACSMGAPAMVSFPHFYLGDPELREKVTGMSPDPAIHASYLDIHPKLGISLHGKSSLQINIQVRKTDRFSALGFLEQGLILPIAWIDMSVDELPESVRSLVYHGTYSTAAAQLGLIVFCTITLFVTGTCLFFLLFRKKQKPCATIKYPMDADTKVVQEES